jgi:hypothetical protein
MRLHDIAARLRITERSAHDIVTDLTAAGYISKHKDDRRNGSETVAHRPFPEPITREKTFREVLALLPGAPGGQPPAERNTAEPRRSAARMRSGHVSHQAACSASTWWGAIMDSGITGNPSLDISPRTVGGITIAELAGELDIASAPAPA